MPVPDEVAFKIVNMFKRHSNVALGESILHCLAPFRELPLMQHGPPPSLSQSLEAAHRRPSASEEAPLRNGATTAHTV